MFLRSADRDRLHGTVDSYQCRINPSSSMDSGNLRGEEVTDYNNRQPQPRPQPDQPINSNNTGDSSITQFAPMSDKNLASVSYISGPRRVQSRQSENAYSRNNDPMAQSAATGGGYPAYTPYNSYHNQYQQPMNSDYRNDYYGTGSSPTNRTNQTSTRDNQPPRYNQHQRGQPFRQNRWQQ